jgi:pyruvate dehydrogenase E2 component (dihydrolipoamide acetyltransferase)
MAEVITMPRLSDSMEEGEIVAWHKKVGDKVAKGDLLAEINSDKATMDFESPKAGTLLYIGVPAGDKLVVGAPLVVIGNEGEAFAHLIGGSAAATPVAEPAAPAAAAVSTAAPVAAVATAATGASSLTMTDAVETHDQSRIFASPLAKEIAKASGIAIENVQGSGDNGRIVKRDVEAAVSKAASTTTVVTTTSVVSAPAVQVVAAKPTPSVSAAFGNEDYTDQPLSSMRKVIAKRLSESLFTAPHFYLTMEINMDKAMELRTQLNAVAAPVKLSFNDIVVKAVAVTLRNHPAINSSWMGDFIRQNNHVNIGVAVAVGQSLFVPVIRNADMKSLGQISTEVRALAGKAKEGKLQLPEMQGSTFTISNLGMFDIEEFTAIINSPDSCILAVGSIMQKPVVKNGEIVVGNVMKITLSCDHRVVDGATGAVFLQELKAKLEDPIRLLV